jgi:hypothetical protein
MARPSLQTVRTAKANVARWFVETPVGVAFLPGDGRALPVSGDEAVAIRASAEARIVETRRQADRGALVLAMVTILGVAAFYHWQQRIEAGWHGSLDAVPYVISAACAVLMADIYWRWERGILLLREAIAHSLLARSSLPPEVAGPRARPEPNYRQLGKLVFALLALIEIAHLAPAFLDGSTAVSESTEWFMIIAAGVIAAILFYIVGETVLAGLYPSPTKHRPRR